MKQLILAIKLFIRDHVLTITTLAFYVFLNALHIESASQMPGYLTFGDLTMLHVTLQASIWIFSFFALISYYYIDKLRFDSGEECVYSTHRGYPGVYIGQLAVLIMAAVLVSVTLIVYNVYAYFVLNINRVEALIHIVLCVLLYIFLVSLVGIGLGTVAALKLKRLTACVTIALFILLTSPLFLRFFEVLYYTFGVDAFPIYEFLCLFPRGLTTMPQHSIGYSLLPDRISATFILLVIFAAPGLMHVFKRQRKIRVVIVILSALICCVSLVVYLIPGAKTLTANNSKGDFAIDRMYYLFRDNQKSEPANFSAISYVMNLDIDNQLKAEVTVNVDIPDRSTYRFTLYRGYHVDKVVDQDGNSLPFIQEGDYIEINNHTNTIRSITFFYQGSNPTYYTHSQGISLPGFFAYYPRCGYHVIYDTKEQGFFNSLLDNPVSFTVNVNYHKQVYSNLEQIGYNSFSGITDGCVLLAGFLASTHIDGVDVVYPYLDSEQFGNGFLEEDLRSFLQGLSDDEKISKIMILPYVNMGTHARFTYYEGGIITCVQLRTLRTYYDRHLEDIAYKNK